VTIGIEHLEKKAIELADFTILPRPETGQWMAEQGWRTTSSLSLGDSGDRYEEGWLRIFQQVLRANAGTSVGQAPLNDAADTTIIITHYEQPDLIEHNLQGLMQQTEKGFAVIVVDDGSKSDKAQRYLDTVEQRYHSLNVKLIRQQNLYLGAARNAGIRAATTEFVILLDDDNVAFPDMVRTLRKAAQTSNADVVTFGLKRFHEENQPPNAAAHRDGAEHYFSAGPILLGSIHNCFGDCSAIYRTNIFGKVGGFHEIHGDTYEDWQMHLRIAAAGFRILSLPEALLWYRIRKGSMLRSTRPYTNARVIASAIDVLPCSALAPLSDYLIGTELEQNRLNRDLERIGVRAALERSTTQAIVAANSNALKGEAGRYVRNLRVTLEERSRSAEEAARYASSLEGTLAQLREANEAAAEYARSLEQSRAETEEYAKTLEAELAKINSTAEN
jgi:GT2 family glycosyltransferase